MTENERDDPIRNRILQAAPAVLARLTLTRFTMKDIARAADVARMTVYRRFPSRDALVVALLVQDMDRRQRPELHRLLDEEPTPDQLVTIFLAEREIASAYPFFDEILSPNIGPRLAALVFASDEIAQARERIWRPILDLYVQHGIVRQSLDVPRAVRWLTWVTFWELTGPEHLDKDPVAHRGYAGRYILGGLLTEGARATMDGIRVD